MSGPHPGGRVRSDGSPGSPEGPSRAVPERASGDRARRGPRHATRPAGRGGARHRRVHWGSGVRLVAFVGPEGRSIGVGLGRAVVALKTIDMVAFIEEGGSAMKAA